MNTNPHYTKSGPGRRHNRKPAEKTLKQKKAGAYGRWLREWITGKNLMALRYAA